MLLLMELRRRVTVWRRWKAKTYNGERKGMSSTVKTRFETSKIACR